MASPLLAPLAATLNRNLLASTPARALLARLAGRSFAIEASAGPTPLLRLRLAADPEGLTLERSAAEADATVSGTPLALAALVAGRARSPGTPSAARGVEIRGDAEVAQAFEQLLALARPDVEEELARLVGGTPAHLVAGAAGAIVDWARRARASIGRQVGEYLAEEARVGVPRAEAEALFDGIERTRDDVERAEARLAILERRRDGAAP